MKLHFRTIGEGKPLVLAHGLFGLSDNLTLFAKMLAVVGYKVYLADMRNHGHSPHAPEHDYPSMAEDLREFILDHQLEHPIVIGHSMGGKAVLQLANFYPQLIKAAVVIDIAPYSYPVHHREIIDALKSVDLNTITTRSQAEAVLQTSIDDYGTRQFLLKNLYWKHEKLEWRFNLSVIDKQIEAIGADTWPATVNEIDVLFVRGTKSNYIKPEREAEIRERYPNAKFSAIEGAGHWVHAEKPNELVAACLIFLNLLNY